MKRIKTLVGVCFALAALTAVSATSSALAAEFHASGGAGVSLTGEQTESHKFTIEGSSVTCTTAKFTGTTTAATATEQKMHPEYSGCTAFGFVGATINTAGCQYVFNSNSANVNLTSCTSGGITITSSSAFGKCVVHVFNQNGINGMSYGTTGTAPNRDIHVKTGSNNISVSITESTGICPLKVGTTVGSYTGVTTVKGAVGEVFYL
ncbi:MAG: hypothetical protein E6G51_03655 [Actinobacteria bacterium]|nr:MAG: hypothetical protein E6G51_03655 [Actinomycetota bacterium]